MKTEKSYSSSILINNSSENVFDKIGEVTKWWSENIEGNSKNLNDIFSIQFAFGDSFEIKVIESIPTKKIAWKVLDSNLTWIKNEKEWKGTQLVFEIFHLQEQLEIRFTHFGLTPEIECFNGCSKGWNYFIHESLFGFLNENKGKPDKKINKTTKES